jgi:hypothetical protein
VEATTDVDRIVALDADVVLHCPLPSLVHGEQPDLDLDVICRLLASGKNVITVVGYLYPKVYGPRVVRRLRDACRRGDTTFHGTGLNPGWMGELLPLTMSALSRRIDRVHVTEITDFVGYPRIDLRPAWLRDGLQATAMHAANAVDAVVAAPQGIKTFLDPPLLTGRGAAGLGRP